MSVYYQSNTKKSDKSILIAIAIVVGIIALIIFGITRDNNYKYGSTTSNHCSYAYDKVTGEYHEMDCEHDYDYLDDLYDDYDRYDDYDYRDYDYDY